MLDALRCFSKFWGLIIMLAQILFPFGPPDLGQWTFMLNFALVQGWDPPSLQTGPTPHISTHVEGLTNTREAAQIRPN